MAKNYIKPFKKMADNRSAAQSVIDWVLSRDNVLDYSQKNTSKNTTSGTKQPKKKCGRPKKNIEVEKTKNVKKNNELPQKFDKDIKDIKRYVKEMHELASIITKDFSDFIKMIEKTTGVAIDINIQNIYNSICDLARDGKERYDSIDKQVSFIKKGIDIIIKNNQMGAK
jgi:lantibiotic modifying enzyme